MILILTSSPAKADITSSPFSSSRGLQEALNAHDGYNIYDGKSKSGFNLAGGFYSGRASGIDPSVVNYTSGGDFHSDTTAELEGDQRMYAVLVDGRYDFNYDQGSKAPIHPYLLGGMGMASYGDTTAPSAGSLAMQNGGMVPLFRVGGGVTYRMDEKWDMSLDYKAGFSGLAGTDQIFTGRGQQQVDLQVLNVGMHYAF